MENKRSIYLILSTNETIPEKLLRKRADILKRGKRNCNKYVHMGISFENSLDDMIAFTRKGMYNIFDAGLAREDINDGMFKKKEDVSKITVIELKINEEQYMELKKIVNYYWNNKEKYKYNFPGLVTMLLFGNGIKYEKRFFCSEWITIILRNVGINLFTNIKPHHIKPFDFYELLVDKIIYEGLTQKYPYKNEVEEQISNREICVL